MSIMYRRLCFITQKGSSTLTIQSDRSKITIIPTYSFLKNSAAMPACPSNSARTSPAPNTVSRFILSPAVCRHATHRALHTVSPDIPSVTLLEMKRVLKQKGLALVDGFTSLAVACFLCEDADPGTLYVNKTTGFFLCPKCQRHGEWSLLRRVLAHGAVDAGAREHFRALAERRRRFAAEWRRVVGATRRVADLADGDAAQLCRNYDYPHYTECVKALAEVRCDEALSTLYYPLRNSLDSVVGYRKVSVGEDGAVRQDSAGHHAAGLYSCRAVRASAGGVGERAVLVSTPADLLCLHRDKVPGRLVWWAEGLLPPAALPALEACERVYVWGGASGVFAAAEKLNSERCLFVRPAEGATSAREAAECGRSLRAALADAAPAAHRAITTFAALRREVFANVTNADKVRGVKWKRFPALTRLLGGHRRGELTVLTGATGCGKTTLTAEMSLDLATEGVNTLWGSFEIRNSRLAQTMLQQHAGLPLEENLHEFERLADEFQRLPIYFLAFHGPQPIPTVMEAVEHALYVHDIAHVIVDNVQFMLGLGGGGGGRGDHGGERFFKQDEVVAAFRTLATRRDCHVTLVMHPRKERDAEDLSTSSIFGSAKASQEADNVLIIQDKRLTAVRGKKFLQVAKNRFSGDLGLVPLEFDRAALSYRGDRAAARREAAAAAGAAAAGAAAAGVGAAAAAGPARAGDSFLSDVLHLDKDR